jgi:hypothetical protein
MRRRLGYGAGGALLSVSILAGALVGAGWASTNAVRLRVAAVRVPLSVACPATAASPGCKITLQLRTTADGTVRGAMVVGRTTALLAPGKRRWITVSLTPRGRRLLRERSPLPVIATTVMTMQPTPALGTSTAPTPAAPTPVPVLRCGPVGSPGSPPIGPGPDAVLGGSSTAGLMKPLDCVA